MSSLAMAPAYTMSAKAKSMPARISGEVFKAMHMEPDFETTHPEADTPLLFAHRKLTEGDATFGNRNDLTENVDAMFRVSGKAPELWHGRHRQDRTGVVQISDGRTTVPLKLEPYGSVFVVFRKPATATSRTVPATTEMVVAILRGLGA